MYSFEAKPKTIAPRKSSDNNDNDGDYLPMSSNLMHDSRVIRGNTYSSNGRKSDSRHEMDRKQSSKSTRKSKIPFLNKRGTIYDLRPIPREYIPVDLTPYLVEAEPKVNESEAITQTDTFAYRPDTPVYTPTKTGIDAYTQIEPEDNLFDFDLEVDPILQVLTSKTIEQALMEVEEEEELDSIRSAIENENNVVFSERKRIEALEAAALQRWKDKEEVVAIEENRLLREKKLMKKYSASTLANQLNLTLKENTYQALSSSGHFPDAIKEEILTRFLPSLFDALELNVNQNNSARAIVDSMIMKALEIGNSIGSAATSEYRSKLAALVALSSEKTGYVRLFIKGLGLNEDETTAVGPIPVVAGDTILQVEEKIRRWLSENHEDFVPPEAGFLKLSYGGKVLEKNVTLLDAEIEDDATIELLESE